jgi:hypothetical protein
MTQKKNKKKQRINGKVKTKVRLKLRISLDIINSFGQIVIPKVEKYKLSSIHDKESHHALVFGILK